MVSPNNFWGIDIVVSVPALLKLTAGYEPVAINLDWVNVDCK